MKVWKYKMPEALTFSKRLPTFLGLTRISALLTGQLVYCSTTEYSILISMNRKSSVNKPVVKLNHDITSEKKSGMCLNIRHDWLLHIRLQVSAPCSPGFQKKSFQATLFRHQICAALILSFIFKLPLKSCNSQMLCCLLYTSPSPRD